jgi:hypothetical protein
MDSITRRRFLQTAAAVGAGAMTASATKAAEVPPAATSLPAEVAAPSVSDEFPTQSPSMVREMVGVSHGNVARVNELLAIHATLANAAWDWGFGDWETALGAASHVGNVEIAKVLLDHGARPTIFSAAMLGQLGVVKAFVEASPGVQGTAGPHGITLLAHARAGKDASKPVLDFLVALGGADPVPKAVDLTPEILARYVGVYTFGARPDDTIEIALDKGKFTFKRGATSPRNLVSLGDHAFHPVGAPAVRVRFTMSGEAAAELAVFDPGVVLRARKVG